MGVYDKEVKMNAKTNIILLSGFLGAGKTTLLKHILSTDADMSGIVVVMNEFGEVGIDGMLLKDSGTDVVELTSGCICCSMSDDLIDTLMGVRLRFQPRWIVIEATGVADPLAVVSAVEHSELKGIVQIDNIITVMDAECWQVRDVFGTLFYRQLKHADTIIFNKIDLLPKDAIAQYLAEIHQVVPDARVVPAVGCRVEPDIVWAPKQAATAPPASRRDDGKPTPGDAGSGLKDRPLGPARADGLIYADATFVTFSFSESAPLEEAAFRRFVEQMPFELFRLKGTVNFGDRTVLINAVGGKTEWAPWPQAAQTRLAFVGWNIRPQAFLDQLKACVHPGRP